jgi:hypothetical protein
MLQTANFNFIFPFYFNSKLFYFMLYVSFKYISLHLQYILFYFSHFCTEFWLTFHILQFLWFCFILHLLYVIISFSLYYMYLLYYFYYIYCTLFVPFYFFKIIQTAGTFSPMKRKNILKSENSLYQHMQ